MLPVETPFKIYTGLTGQPLNNGYVYFGTANQNPITSPITVYWDAAGTQPAAQPLRTVNGYIVRAGTPANVFVGVSYSELVKDSTGQQVFYARTSDDFSIATAVLNFITNLAASGGSALVGFIQAGVGAVLQTVQAVLRERVSVSNYGADPTGVTDSTAAFTRAKVYLASKGGGIARIPLGTYKLTNFDLDEEGVMFVGESTGFLYAKVAGGVKLVPGSGAVYVARLKGTRSGVVINAAEGSGFKNVQFYEAASGVTEYGLFVDSGGTEVDSVQVSGFQYGIACADQLNQNVFNKINVILNTKVGFAVTEHQGAAYLHPNVTGITSVSNTTFFLTNSSIRQNGFGMVLRSCVGASFENTVIESNDQAGIYMYRTDVNSLRELKFDNVWMENNYQAYTSGALTYSIVDNNMLKITDSVTYIAWTSLNQAGYQMVIDSQTHFGGGGDTMEFEQCKFNCAGVAQKAILILSGFKFVFRKPWLNGGDTANLVRITTDAEAVHWHDPLADNDPVALVTSITASFGANAGTRGAYYKSGTSFGTAELGGQYPILGVNGGPLHFLAPVASDPRQADDRCFYTYQKTTAFAIAWRTGSAIPFTVNTESNILVRGDRTVTIWLKGTITVASAVGTNDKFFCNAQLPFQALQTDHVVGQVVIKPTGGGAAVVNNGCSPMEMNAVASAISVLDVFAPLVIGNTFSYEVQLTYYAVTY
jgi:hypothetical protein